MNMFHRSPSRFARRRLLALEPLEDRTLLSGNLLITGQDPILGNYNLQQYTQQGNLVSSQAVPPAPGSTETPDVRGLSVDPSGNVNIFDGTQTPALATISLPTPSSVSQSWLFQAAPGWGIGSNNNITYGNVVAYKNAAGTNYVFASDMQQLNGQSYGIVRFDSSGGAPTFYAPGSSFIQIALGQDGYLYGLESASSESAMSQTVEVFNPDTLAWVRTITLNTTQSPDIRSIATDGAGNIFAASYGGTVAEYDPNGNATGASVQLDAYENGPAENLIDIALDTDGQIAVGGAGGEIYLTDESLTNVQTIQTNQSNVFVTFDHYIGTAPQLITPSFTNLSGPRITYGQSSVTLGGTISANSTYPPGSVNITVNGVTQPAAINQTNGTFSAVFDTSTLGVSNSPYTITYSYPGQDNYAAVTDTSQSLTVTQAVTTLNNLSSPTVVIGTPTATFSGTVGSNSVLPAGQFVTVTLLGANGALASSSGVIGSGGSFSATISTDALPAGSYTIQYSYAGDANFQASSGTRTLQVTYAVTSLSNTSNPVQAGAALPVMLQVSDASGDNLASTNLVVTAISLVGPGGKTYTPQAEGDANPGNVFRNVGFGYLYNLDTTGLVTGTYTLYVEVGDDPVLHAVSFVVD
jgi:hypothetical protein